MNLRMIVALVALFTLAGFLCAVYVSPVDAAVGDDNAAGGDKNIADKKGMAGVFAGKGLDKTKGPNATQKWLGIGSLVVAFLVVKFL